MHPRVILAMSGGVDSSVAALLLKQQGYDVIGLFMRTGVHTEDSCVARDSVADRSNPPRSGGLQDRDHPPRSGGLQASHKKGCCSSLDAADARRVAERLDIPFYALDFEADFDRIIDYFVDEYARGRTPNPCVMCNNWLKFGKLWAYGKQMGADYVATGHYAQITRDDLGGSELHMASDPAKDQSYVLFGLRRQMLSRLLFPVGDMPKDRIRELAHEAELPVFNKPDSQEICFVPNGNYAEIVRKRRPELATAGTMVNTSGEVLAEHDGIENFTIGQRKGLGYAAGSRRYVLKIIPEESSVVVGSREELLATGLIADQINWLIDPPTEPLSCRVKIRYRSQPVPATVFIEEDQTVRVEFESTQPAITPGQAAVFYEGTRVLGGGWIQKSLPE